MISPILVENVPQIDIIISYKFHRIPDRQSRYITKVHDLLGQPSYSVRISRPCMDGARTMTF